MKYTTTVRVVCEHVAGCKRRGPSVTVTGVIAAANKTARDRAAAAGWLIWRYPVEPGSMTRRAEQAFCEDHHDGEHPTGAVLHLGVPAPRPASDPRPATTGA